MTKLEKIKAILDEDSDKPTDLAEAFCELDDHDQAKFFINCARIMSTWEGGLFKGHGAGLWQMYQIGKKLKQHTNVCELIMEIAMGFTVEENKQ